MYNDFTDIETQHLSRLSKNNILTKSVTIMGFSSVNIKKIHNLAMKNASFMT